ncbi:MAG: NAD(P)-dependent oxidoreductase [Gordonia sp. (in: high G+C Gram-positive bacteria)]|uniref:NAD-dependent epimerase/dehydratase family protein n=1 Tax=Gordonia sp. (in: high G+C Gram-positive bacteria) TaxID=84139 RepID=UPI0039E4E7E8
MNDSPPPRTVAVIGATGFCGSGIVDRCLARGHRVRAVSRHPAPAHHDAVTAIAADITAPETLAPALDGADVVIHAASYTGTEHALARETNEHGTARIAEAVQALGIDSLIHLSTIGVYGAGPFRERTERDAPRPVTDLSRSRRAGEEIVQGTGGLVLRPGFVHGPGPQSFLTGLARIITALGALVDDGAARQSIVSTADLAAITTTLAGAPIPDHLRGTVVNVADDTPQTIRDLWRRTSDADVPGGPLPSISYAEALDRAAGLGLTPRHIDLVAADHTLDTRRIRAVLEDLKRK